MAMIDSWGVDEAAGAARPVWQDYRGPERRRRTPTQVSPLMRALDEIDLGLLLLDAQGQVHYANHMARARLATEPALSLKGGCLAAAGDPDQLRLKAAVHAAAVQGLRRLLTLGTPGARLTLSVIPMELGRDQAGALLMMGKPQLCGELSIHAFAREHGLTSAEQGVLQALCEGLPPQEIAARHQVAVSTIRTQISSLRAKTHAESIRDLVGMVALLPPMLGVLRGPPLG